MLDKLISSVKRASRVRGSQFDSYYRNIAGSGLPGGPTADEAKREFSRYLRDMNKGLRF